jgi:outer membrane protein TolC
VVTAQTVSLSNRQAALTIRQQELVATVTLIQSLGGGWQLAELDAPLTGSDQAKKPSAQP